MQTDRFLLWEELERQWRDLITLCNDPSSIGNQLLDVGQRLGSSYPDQLAKGMRVYSYSIIIFMFFLLLLLLCKYKPAHLKSLNPG